jgi:hypothetical protein
MRDIERRHSIQPGFRIGALELSYRDMTIDASGSVMSRDQKVVLRQSFGYCTTCMGAPMLLFDIRKSRLNPLWMSKKPRTMESECLDGQCLPCKRIGRPDIPLSGAPSARSIYSRSSSFATNDSSHSQEPQRFDMVTRVAPLPSTSGHGNSESLRAASGAFSHTAVLPGALSARSIYSRSSSFATSDSSHSQESQAIDMVTRVAPIPSPSGRGNSESLRAASGAFSHTAVLATSSQNAPQRQLSNDSHQLQLVIPNGSSRSTVSLGRTFPSRSLRSASIGSNPRAPIRQTPLLSRSEHAVQTPRAERAISSISAQDERLHHQSASTPNIRSDDTGTESSTESSLLGDSPSQQSNAEKAIRDLEPLVKDLLEAGEASSDMLIEILASSMDSFPSVERFQSFCLQYIWESCKTNTEAYATSLMASTLHENIMKAVKSFPSSEKVQEYGCKIVFALAAHSSNRVVLVRSGVCSFLAEAMANFMENVSLVRNVVGALRNLSLDTEAREELNSIFAWKGTVEAMRRNSEDAAIQRDGCALLSNLAVDAKKKVVLSVSNEVLGAVVYAIESHRSDMSVVTSARTSHTKYRIFAR